MNMPKKSSSELNELRLYANEIMRQLYEAGERGQLDILVIYGKICIECIDREQAKTPAAASLEKRNGGGK